MTGICNGEKLMEYARHGLEPDTVLRLHLKCCSECRERYEGQKLLTRQLGVMRAIAADRRSSSSSRDVLMRRLAVRQPAPSSSKSNRWLWSFAAAAVLFISLMLVHAPRQASVRPGLTKAAGADAPAYLAMSDSQDEGFIAVPFVPPLATGELMRVVHTELYPAALASLGVNVDPALTSGVSADLLMGEDGFPRAVRVSAEAF